VEADDWYLEGKGTGVPKTVCLCGLTLMACVKYKNED
jgi:hypothetical protein